MCFNIFLMYHVVLQSCRHVLLIEICLTVIVFRVPSPSVVGIVPSLSQREFLIFDTQHFLYKKNGRLDIL